MIVIDVVVGMAGKKVRTTGKKNIKKKIKVERVIEIAERKSGLNDELKK